jgi:hypothetical protein
MTDNETAWSLLEWRARLGWSFDIDGDVYGTSYTVTMKKGNLIVVDTSTSLLDATRKVEKQIKSIEI